MNFIGRFRLNFEVMWDMPFADNIVLFDETGEGKFQYFEREKSFRVSRV